MFNTSNIILIFKDVDVYELFFANTIYVIDRRYINCGFVNIIKLINRGEIYGFLYLFSKVMLKAAVCF